MTSSESANAPLLEERHANVAILTMNRPERRNTLSDEMIGTLDCAFKALADDSDVHAIILRANGPAFCAGHDLREMTAHREEADGGHAAFSGLFDRCTRLMTGIMRHPKPVIAEIQGSAYAAGCQLVASCDLAVASEQACFSTPGVNIGLFCSTPMVALGRNVPRKRAMEMLLFGGAIDAQRAAEYGLVNRVVAIEILRKETLALAETIASKSPVAIRFGKRAFHDQLEMTLDDAYTHMGRIMALNMLDADASEGIDAFLQKRAPDWPTAT